MFGNGYRVAHFFGRAEPASEGVEGSENDAAAGNNGPRSTALRFGEVGRPALSPVHRAVHTTD